MDGGFISGWDSLQLSTEIIEFNWQMLSFSEVTTLHWLNNRNAFPILCHCVEISQFEMRSWLSSASRNVAGYLTALFVRPIILCWCNMKKRLDVHHIHDDDDVEYLNTTWASSSLFAKSEHFNCSDTVSFDIQFWKLRSLIIKKKVVPVKHCELVYSSNVIVFHLEKQYTRCDFLVEIDLNIVVLLSIFFYWQLGVCVCVSCALIKSSFELIRNRWSRDWASLLHPTNCCWRLDSATNTN